MVPTFTGSCACRVPKRPSTTECRKGSQQVTFQTHPTRLSCHHRAFLVRPPAVDSKAASLVTQASQRPMLQDHVAFFDSDDDGIIWPVDTFHGFQKLGFGPPTAVIQALAIHLPNSFKTLPQGQSFDPRFPIYVENIHKAKHGSDTGSFSKTGDFVKEKFEEIWIRYDTDKKGFLTQSQVMEMLEERKEKGDSFGALGARLEWTVTFQLAGKKVGDDVVLSKDDALAILNGSFFYTFKPKPK